jgi:hypothetical protein
MLSSFSEKDSIHCCDSLKFWTSFCCHVRFFFFLLAECCIITFHVHSPNIELHFFSNITPKLYICQFCRTRRKKFNTEYGNSLFVLMNLVMVTIYWPLEAWNDSILFRPQKYPFSCWICLSHSSDREYCLLGCDGMSPVEVLLCFGRTYASIFRTEE